MGSNPTLSAKALFAQPEELEAVGVELHPHRREQAGVGVAHDREVGIAEAREVVADQQQDVLGRNVLRLKLYRN